MLRKLMRMEERIVLDGAAAPDAQAEAAEPVEVVESADPSMPVDPVNPDGPTDADASEAPEGEASEASAEEAAGDPAGSLRALLISDSLTQGQQLADAAMDNVLAMVYSAQDTPAEILEALQGELDGRVLDSIALAGHGQASGGMQLTASDPLNLATLAERPEVQQFWDGVASLLGEGGRIDLLGCNLAAGDQGQALVEQLEALTGHDVAASTDATGTPDTGGDWVLETDSINLVGTYFEASSVEGLEGIDLANSNPAFAGLASSVTFSETDVNGGAREMNLTDVGFGFASGVGSAATFEQANDVFIDDDGTVYLTGKFQGTVDFDPGAGTVNKTAVGGYDIFVQKLNADGSLAWVVTYGGSDGGYVAGADSGNVIEVDDAGNVYVGGTFRCTMDWDPGAGVHEISTPNNQTNSFILKLDANGGFVQAGAFLSNSIQELSDLAVDDAGNMYAIGTFDGTVDFDPGAGTTNIASNDPARDQAYMVKLNADGSLGWAKTIFSTTSVCSGYGITVDDAGNVYTTGAYNGTMDADPGAGTANLVSNGSWDIFVQKLDATGAYVWANTMGGAEQDMGKAIVVDGGGNLYVVGDFYATVDFDPGAGTTELTSTWRDDIFVQKLAAADGSFAWARSFGSAHFDKAFDVAVDDVGSVYTIGYFGQTADFDPGAGTANLTLVGQFDVFVQKMDLMGNYVWAKGLGSAGWDEGYGISVNEGGTVAVAGRYDGTMDADPTSGTFNLVTNGDEDGFVATMTQQLVDTDSADFDTGALTITGVLAGETLSLMPAGGDVEGSVRLDGANVQVYTAGSWQTFGTWAGGTGADLTITFNNLSTAARAQSIINRLTYANSNDNPTASHTLGITLTDGDGGSTPTHNLTVNVTAVNDDPTLAGLPTDVTVTEDVASNVDLSAVTLTDPDSGSSNITLTLAASGGTLASTTAGGVTVGGSGTGTLTLTGTSANIDTFLNTASNIQYTGASNVNGDNAATITLTANDGGNTGAGGGGDVNLGTVNVDITAVNDNPTATGVPSDVTFTEDTAGNLDLSAITLTDVDAGANDITVTLAAGAGTLTSASGGGVTVGGSGTQTVTLTGTVANIDTFLNNAAAITYTPAAEAAGNDADTVTLTANDGGHTGPGGGTNVTLGTINVDITAVNDDPSIAGLPADISFTEDVTGNVDLSAVTLSDVDSGASNITLTLAASGGILNATTGGGVTVGGSGTGTLTLTGTVANIDTFLNTASNITYTGAANVNGNDAATLTLTANDGGNTGAGGGGDVNLGTVNLDILAVNDDPTMTGAPASLTTVEDTHSNLDLSSVTLADVDSGANNITVTLAVNSGVLTSASAGGVTVGGSNTPTVTLTGTVADIDTFLNTATNIKYFAGAEGFGDNYATLTITANDGGNTGAGGGGDVALATVNINVTGVNDDPTGPGAPADVNFTEDVTGDLDLSNIALSDIDAGSGNLTFKLVASGGTLTAGSAGGVTVAGSGTGTLTLTGTVANIDTYLNTASNIKYTGAANVNGNDAATVTITVNDNGNTGTGGGGDINLGTVNVDIAAVNDAPVLNTPIASQQVDPDELFDLTFPADTFTEIEGQAMTYTATLADGSPLPAWLTFTAGTRNFNGTPTDDDLGLLQVKLTADDGAGGVTSHTFNLRVQQEPQEDTGDEGGLNVDLMPPEATELPSTGDGQDTGEGNGGDGDTGLLAGAASEPLLQTAGPGPLGGGGFFGFGSSGQSAGGFGSPGIGGLGSSIVSGTPTDPFGLGAVDKVLQTDWTAGQPEDEAAGNGAAENRSGQSSNG